MCAQPESSYKTLPEAADLGCACSGKGRNTMKGLAKGSAEGNCLLQVVWEDRARESGWKWPRGKGESTEMCWR